MFYIVMVADDLPPSEMKTTPLSRAMAELEILIDSRKYAPFFRNVDTISGLFEEQKRLTKKAQLLYFLTFAGACLILLGPLPSGLRLSLAGVEAPVSLIPQQLIALITAVAFGQYAVLFGSMLALGQMTERILRREGAETWQFFAARFDASTLWAAALLPKQIGYRSPKRHVAIALLIVLVIFASLLAHSLTVCASTAFALWSAWKSGSWILILVALAAVAISLVSFLSVLCLFVLRMPFRSAENSGLQKVRTTE